MIYGSWSSHAMGIQTECVCKSLMKMDWWTSPNPNANTMLKVGMWTTTSMGLIESNLPPALGFPEQTSASLRLIIARWPCFVSDGRRSPRRARISFHIMVTSLQRLWSVADVSADVHASLGSASCLLADLFDGTLVGGGWVWGGGGGVIKSFPRRSHRSSLSCNIQHALGATWWNLFLMLSIWEVLHVSRLICSTARWLGGSGFGGWGGVIRSFPRRS